MMADSEDPVGVTGTEGPRLYDFSSSRGQDGSILTSKGGNGIMWRKMPVFTVPNIAALRQLKLDFAELIYVQGYYSPRDRGEGFFSYSNTAAPDDGAYTIRSVHHTVAGAFRRDLQDKRLTVYQAGAGTSAPNQGEALDNAINVCNNYGLTLVFPEVPVGPTDEFDIDRNLTFTCQTEVYSAYFKSANYEVRFEGPTRIVHDREMRFRTSDITLSFKPGSLTEVRPEWWGAVADGTVISGTDNSAALTAMYDAIEGTGIVANYMEEATYFGSYNSHGNLYKIGANVNIRAVSKFSGTSGIAVNGTSAHLTVSAPIISSDKPVFFVTGSPNPITWGDGAGPRINVTWFQVVGDGVTTNGTAVAVLVNACFSPASSKKANWYFPSGTFLLAGTYDLSQFALETHPGARLKWGGTSCDLTLGEVIDTPNPIFSLPNFEALPPKFTKGLIRPEWFRGVSSYTDIGVLGQAFRALMRATYVGASVTTENAWQYGEYSRTWLDGSNREYEIDSTVLIYSGNPTYLSSGTSKGMGVRNITFKKTIADSNPALAPHASTTIVDMVYQDVSVEGTPGMGGVLYPVILIDGSEGTKFDRCSFRSAIIKAQSGVTNASVRHSSFSNSRFDLLNVNGFEASQNNIIDNVTATASAGTFLLTTCDRVAISNNKYVSTLLSGSTMIRKMAFIDRCGTVGFNQNEVVEGGIVVVNPGSTSLDGLDSFIAVGNKFRADYLYGYSTSAPSQVQKFIELRASGVNVSMIDVLIKDNSFNSDVVPAVPAPSLTFPGRYATMVLPPELIQLQQSYITFEAIALSEAGGNSFDDEAVFDVIVKDNIGNKNVNIRTTELVDSGLVYATTASLTIPNKESLPSRRLVGVPQQAQISAGPTLLGNGIADGGANLSLPFLVGTEVSLEDGSARYKVWTVKGKYIQSASNTILNGFCPTNSFALYTVKYKTYKSRENAWALAPGLQFEAIGRMDTSIYEGNAS